MSRVVHVVAVGRSILDTHNKHNVPNAARRAIKDTLDPDWLAHQAGPHGPAEPVHAAILAATDAGSGRLDIALLLHPSAAIIAGLRADPGRCAEWQSVAVEKASPPAGDPDDGDAYVLITTDTDDGLRAAAFVAAGLAGNGGLFYIDDPLSVPWVTGIGTGRVLLCRVPGLDLANPSKITSATWTALGRIGHAITEAVRAGGQWRIVLHLSGGYKAILPYLLVMGEGINSVLTARGMAPLRPTLRAIATHESAEDHRIEIPVRALRGHAYTDLMKLAAGSDPSDLPNSALLGLCHDDTELTTMGIIMVNVAKAL